MRWTHMVMIIFLAGLARPAQAATYYLTVINDTADTVSLMEITPAGTSAWVSVISDPVRGGRLDETTLAFPDGGCLWDLRVTEVDHPPLTIRGWNVCRQDRLRLGKAFRKARTAPLTQAYLRLPDSAVSMALAQVTKSVPHAWHQSRIWRVSSFDPRSAALT